jgi:hypothetical protein
MTTKTQAYGYRKEWFICPIHGRHVDVIQAYLPRTKRPREMKCLRCVLAELDEDQKRRYLDLHSAIVANAMPLDYEPTPASQAALPFGDPPDDVPSRAVGPVGPFEEYCQRFKAGIGAREAETAGDTVVGSTRRGRRKRAAGKSDLSGRKK